jgi:hypothetical protein
MLPTRRDVLAAPAVTLVPRPLSRSVVWVWLAGGPSADDLFTVCPNLCRLVVHGYGHTVTSHTRATHLTLTGVDHPGIDDGDPQAEPSIGSRIAVDRGRGTYVRIGRTTCDGPGRLGSEFAPVNRPSTGDIRTDLIAARQTCVAGAAFVLVHHADWDLHADAISGAKRLGPPLAEAVAEFLDADNGNTLVVLTGEFGRTRQLNRHGGRDHDPTKTPLLIAGATPPPIRNPAELVRFVHQWATRDLHTACLQSPA